MKEIRRDSIATILREMKSKRDAYKNAAIITKSELLISHYNGFEECLALLETRKPELLDNNQVTGAKILISK